ncbi:MAG: helix-turn-helix domain-containing protein [Thermoanaerobaculia bacterium]
MKTYTLLNGKTLDLSELSPAEGAFLRGLRRMTENDISYFEICRSAIGPGSPALRGRQTIDRRTAATPLYLAAEDIATRAGIQQGLILAPEFEHLRAQFPTDGSHISAAQAADFIGISRAAVYKAINAGTLQALRIGNVTVVNKKSAVEYRQRRESGVEQPVETAETPLRASSVAAKAKAKEVRVAGRRARTAHG